MSGAERQPIWTEDATVEAVRDRIVALLDSRGGSARLSDLIGDSTADPTRFSRAFTGLISEQRINLDDNQRVTLLRE
jgi:hypothetical protein